MGIRYLAILPAMVVLSTLIADASPKVEPLTKLKGFGPEIDLRDELGPISDAVWSSTSRAFPLRTENENPVEIPKVYEHTQMREDLEYMESFAPDRRRVAVRAVAHRRLPILYAPYHWLPDAILETTRRDVAENGGRDLLSLWQQSGVDFLGEDHAVWDALTLFGLLNIRVYHDADADNQGGGSQCCAPHSELVIELAVDESDVRYLRMSMYQTDTGVYYVTDPIQVAHQVVSEVISIGDRPLMTIVGMEGLGYLPPHSVDPISYAVRWGDLELEIGAHYAGDPKGVLR